MRLDAIPFFIFLGVICIFLIYAHGWALLIYETLVIVIITIIHMFNNG